MPNDAATTRVLVWDDLDMHATLASVLVDEPGGVPEIDLEAVFLWLDARCQGDEAPDAYLFTTVEPGREADDVARITEIRTKGFGAVVRRGRRGDGSVHLTELLRRHVDTTLTGGSVVELIVASHDGDRLAARLQDIAGGPVTVTVLGFRERALFAADHPRLRFVDLEEVPGVFDGPLPRTNLYDLTDDGRVLPALRRPRGASARRTRHAPDWTSWPRPSRPDRPERPSEADRSPSGAGLGDTGGHAGGPTPPAGRDGTGSLPVPPITTPPAPPSRPAWSPSGAAAPWNAERATTPAPPPPPPAPGGPAPEASTHGLIGEPVPPPPDIPRAEPIPAPPAQGGALDDLLAGVQPSSLAPTPPMAPRPGRVSPPNGSLEPPADSAPGNPA